MKKIFVILLVLCLVLAGCNNQTDSISSKELFSSDFSSAHSSSDISKFESSSNINASSELAEEVIEEGGACGNIEFHASFESTDEFIQWAKIGGENTDWSFSKSKDNPCSLFFLDWLKNKSELTLPKLKNNDFYLSLIKIEHEYIRFNFFNNSKTSRDYFVIYAYPLASNQENLSLEDLGKTFSTEIYNPKLVESNWGKCLIGNISGMDCSSSIFVKSSVFFVVNAKITKNNTIIKPWQEEYFDYFDFETVSLK